MDDDGFDRAMILLVILCGVCTAIALSYSPI